MEGYQRRFRQSTGEQRSNGAERKNIIGRGEWKGEGRCGRVGETGVRR